MFLLLKEFIGSEPLTYKHNISREFLLLCGVLFKYFWEREILWEWNFSFLQDVLYVFLHLSFPPLLVLPSYFPSSPLSLISASLLCSFLLPSLFFVLVLPFILLWFIPFLFSFFISCLFFLFPYIFSCPYIFPSLYSSFLSVYVVFEVRNFRTALYKKIWHKLMVKFGTRRIIFFIIIIKKWFTI